jgi:hypothetical protein
VKSFASGIFRSGIETIVSSTLKILRKLLRGSSFFVVNVVELKFTNENLILPLFRTKTTSVAKQHNLIFSILLFGEPKLMFREPISSQKKSKGVFCETKKTFFQKISF